MEFSYSFVWFNNYPVTYSLQQNRVRVVGFSFNFVLKGISRIVKKTCSKYQVGNEKGTAALLHNALSIREVVSWTTLTLLQYYNLTLLIFIR